MKLTNIELKNINGGSLSGTLINSFVRGIYLVFELGKALGSALIRLKNKTRCAL